MKNLFDITNMKILLIIPIHDVENFRDVRIYEAELTKLNIVSDEVKERIIASSSDEPTRKQADSYNFDAETNTFDSKTTLKKNPTFDSSGIGVEMSEIKIETSGATVRFHVANPTEVKE